MRLHHLDITAFGPYAGTESIDLDRLARSGLFLLEGPTGAGKSTILDAITFALYGRTASEASSTDRLHSQFADPDSVPRVILELSLGSDRLRVTRTPEYERPKRRGTGTTRERASALVQRRVDGDWETVATSLQDAGTYLSDRLGLQAGQFTQVALLPQGEFMRTLRQAWGMPIGLPATGWMASIGAAFMGTDPELVMKSRRVVPGRLTGAGFTFKYATWAEAAQNLARH